MNRNGQFNSPFLSGFDQNSCWSARQKAPAMHILGTISSKPATENCASQSRSSSRLSNPSFAPSKSGLQAIHVARRERKEARDE